MTGQGKSFRDIGFGVASLLALIVLTLHAGTSWGQSPHDSLGAGDGSPDVPPGNAAIFGQLLHPEGSSKTQGSTIVLYSLAADGSPGVRTEVADASGEFRFTNLSNASGITYLVGASYRGVPYGKRVAFEPGQDEIALVIDVDDPSADSSRISVTRSSLRVEWIGASLGIEEVHQLDNPDERVILVPAEERTGKQPPFRVTLPEGATRLDTTLSGVSEGYQERGRELSFWGPIYAGGLELRFRYLIPVAELEAAETALAWQLDSGSQQATLLYPPSGPTLSLAGFEPGADVVLGEIPFRSLDAGAIAPGDILDVAVALPVMRKDLSAISIPRADIWLDADDTFLQANVEISLSVAPGAPLAGDIDAPLFVIDLPTGAELRGLSPEAQNMGMMPIAGGDLGVIGPLPPGTSNLAFRYRLAVQDGKPQIDLRLPRAVDVLNVLIADTGVAIESDRLHRRRPFRQGPRIYLHREAFAIDEGEVVSLGLRLLDRGTVGRNTHLFSSSALAALGVWFIVSPLVRKRVGEAGQLERARIRSELDLVYESIRDLEHDFETQKIEEAEYAMMRGELRGRALALLQQDRDAAQAPVNLDSASTPPQQPSDRCSGCGAQLEADWRFCPSCGASPQQPADETAPANP
jgi:hypothetical protein